MILTTNLSKYIDKKISIYLPGNLNPAVVAVPVISNVVVSGVTDAGFTIAADVLSTKASASVFLHYGLTGELTETPIEFIGSPIAEGATATNVSLTLNSLLPYKQYYYSIIATSTSGSAIYNGSLITHEPVELSDGNWAAQYEFDGEENIVASNLVSQLRDNNQGNTLGNELVSNGDFSTTTGWTLNGAGSITGDKLNLNTSGFTTIWRSDNTSHRYKVYTSSFDVDSITGTLKFYCPNPSPANITTSGTKTFSAYIQDGTYIARIGANNASLVAVIDNFSTKQILGNHLVQWTDTNKPTKNTAYIECDGVDNWMRTSATIPTIGTIYAFVQRIGTDSDFTMRNDLTGIGEYAASYFRLGSNQAGTTWYNVRLKSLRFRTVTDSELVKDKLNEYFSRQDNLVLGVTPNGIYSNSAVFANDVIWNNGI